MASNPFDFSGLKKAKIMTSADAATSDDVVIGTNYSDTLYSGDGNDQIAGGNGDDTMYGGNGNDKIWGDSINNSSSNDNGQDTLYGDGGSDELHGGNGKDYLDGGTGNDVLFGDNGSDTLKGGMGADVLTGGNGPDTFVYSSAAESKYVSGDPGSLPVTWAAASGSSWTKCWDVITDFTSGLDKIDLTQLNPGLAGPGPAKLTWSDTTETDAAAGSVNAAFAHSVWSDSTHHFIYADVNGDGAADLKIQVQGVGSGDFLGVNHAPHITSPAQSGDVQEDVTLLATGQVTATDSDGDALHYSGTASGTYGSFIVDDSVVPGSWEYDLANSASNVQALAQGEEHDENFTVTVTDPYGATASQQVTVHVYGTNDAAVFATYSNTDGHTTASVVDSGGTEAAESAPFTAQGTIGFSDVDWNDTHTVYVTSADGTIGSLTVDAGDVTDTTQGAGGSLTWHYSVNDDDIDGLTNASQTFTVHLVEHHPDNTTSEVTQDISIALTGDDDSAAPADPNDFDNEGSAASVSSAAIQGGNAVHGTAGDDTINGGTGDDLLYGGPGDDTIHGQGGNDTIYGGSGNDIINGNDANDIIYGGSGNDTINGNNGADEIIGGYGADTLTGGTGGPPPANVNNADTFVYFSATDSPSGPGNFDTINDFTHAADTLDLSAVAGVTSVAPAALNVGDPLAAGEVGWVLDGSGNTIVYANTSAVSEVVGTNNDMEIHLTGVTNLSSGDIHI